MSRQLLNRRNLLRTGALASVGGAALVATARPAHALAGFGAADLAIVGGTFHTMDPAYARANAMAIRGDRILAVGQRKTIDPLIGPATKVIDARGLTVTPGFIDAHSHPLMANEAISANVATLLERADRLEREADSFKTE